MSKSKKYNIKTIPTNDGKAHYTEDGFINLTTMLGVYGKDKSVSGVPVYTPVDKRLLEELYSSDDIANKIVERLPKDGLREWIEFSNLDKEIEAKLNDIIKKLDLKSKLQEAWSTARLYGGAGIFINFGEAINGDARKKLIKPVNTNSIRSVKSLAVLDRHKLKSGSLVIEDITDPLFGFPVSYEITTDQSMLHVHSSRIVRFEGAKLPSDLFKKNKYWNDSVLTKIFQIISNFNQSHGSIANMILDFRVSIIKLKNLFQMVAQGDEKKVKERMELIKMQKSVISMVLLNEGEEFEQNTTSLAGVKDIIQQINDRMVAASGYPHTILLGESPSGMAATGESELRDYYDSVAQEQEAVLRKPLEKIFEYIFLSKEGPTNGKIPENFDFEFVSLWQMSEEERAKMELDVAKKDEIYIANGVLDPDEVAISRYGGKDFSQDTKLRPKRVEGIKERNGEELLEGEMSMELESQQ